MVKIIAKSGDEEKFDRKDVERDLESAGLPERVAEEVAERVEDRVQDRWTSNQVREQINLELKRLEEDIEKAHKAFEGDTTAPETSRYETTTTQTFVPERDTQEKPRDYKY